MKTRRRRKISGAITLIAALLFVVPVQAVPLSVQNPSFEKLLLDDGAWTTSGTGLVYDYLNDVDYGWEIDPADWLYVGVFNPNPVQYSSIPHGENVTHSTGAAIYQTLSDVLTANTHYSLRVDVGHVNGDDFGGYNVQLKAGGSLLAEDYNSNVPTQGLFSTSLVEYTALPGDPLLGQPLEIRLNSLGHPGGDTNYDNVRLSATPLAIPEPTSLLLIGSGLIGCVVLKRKGRTR